MRTFEPGKLPAIGDELGFEPDDKSEPTVNVQICCTYGLAEIMGVTDEKGEHGIAAFQPNGSWWWIRKIEHRDGWQSDADGWKKDG